MFLNPQLTNEYVIGDLFEVKQGKMIIDKTIKIDNLTDKSLNVFQAKFLTLNSVNFEMNDIDDSLLGDYISNSFNYEKDVLSANDFIINRVGKNKGLSLINVDFDFNGVKLLASHHFIVLKPRKIILHNLPFFHMLLEVTLKKLLHQKNDVNPKNKIQHLTVKELQNYKISFPKVGLEELTRSFMEVYEPYKNSLQSFIKNKKNLEAFKNKFNL